MCIGGAMAMLEIKIILAMILQQFRLQLVPRAKINTQIGIALIPKHGIPMVVQPQDRQFPAQAEAVRGNIHTVVNLEPQI
jgi:hypothetical protein